jgi:hypothetical protein
MFQRSSLSVLAVVAVGGALIAGCSSSPSSSSAPAATSSAPAASTSAAASSPAASAAATGVSAADCKIISPISSSVITTLAPLESEPTATATAGIKAYIAKLTADEAKLTSAAGKAALGSFITALDKSLTEPESQATTSVTTAVGNLAAACS